MAGNGGADPGVDVSNSCGALGGIREEQDDRGRGSVTKVTSESGIRVRAEGNREREGRGGEEAGKRGVSVGNLGEGGAMGGGYRERGATASRTCGRENRESRTMRRRWAWRRSRGRIVDAMRMGEISIGWREGERDRGRGGA